MFGRTPGLVGPGIGMQHIGTHGHRPPVARIAAGDADVIALVVFGKIRDQSSPS
jgi:hypothetical protein